MVYSRVFLGPSLPALHALEIGDALQGLLEPAERLRAGRMRGKRDYVELEVVLVEVAPHLEPASDVQPAQVIHVVHAEGPARRPGEERRRRVLADPVVGDGVPFGMDHMDYL